MPIEKAPKRVTRKTTGSSAEPAGRPAAAKNRNAAKKAAPARKTPAKRSPAKKAAPAKKTGAKRTPRSHHYSVYVVLLDDAVWNSPRFRKANPDHVLGAPCVYVGMTGLDPDVRFDKHKAGIQANRFVTEHGLRLLPHLYEVYNPMPYAGAAEMEVELGIGLREQGFGVWQG